MPDYLLVIAWITMLALLAFVARTRKGEAVTITPVRMDVVDVIRAHTPTDAEWAEALERTERMHRTRGNLPRTRPSNFPNTRPSMRVPANPFTGEES